MTYIKALKDREKHTYLMPFPAIAIVGPTAVGKTSLSIFLAEKLGGEIINFDSMQVYKGFDIGTAKPTKEERSIVPHHLFDIREPDEPFDAAEFVRLAISCAKYIRKKGKVPIFVGGTGFYLRSLEYGLDPAPSRNPALRSWLEEIIKQKGKRFLWQVLHELSPKIAKKIHINDTYRLIRNIEILITKDQVTDKTTVSLKTDLLKIGLIRPREQLYKIIDQRVDQMIKQGLLDEVKSLLLKGYSPLLKPMKSIGYKQMVDYLCGELSWEEAIYQIKRDTRRYAKRQLTWFKADPSIRWFNPEVLMTHKSRLWDKINRID